MPSVKLIIKRPTWKAVSEAYDEINKVGKEEHAEVLRTTQNVYNAELAQAQKGYEKVGGQALREFNRDSNAFLNTCAFRVSYALNYGGMPIAKYRQIKPSALILKDRSGNSYFLRVKELLRFIQSKEVWGNADEPYNPKIMNAKQENIDFYNNEFSKLDKNGVVAMIISGWSDAGEHITLWDRAKKQFADYDSNLQNNYLLYGSAIVKALYFWELQ